MFIFLNVELPIICWHLVTNEKSLIYIIVFLPRIMYVQQWSNIFDPILKFESCLESSSDHVVICIKLDLVESEKVFSMKVIHAEPPFPCDYVRNGYCKRVITSTAESKRVF